MLASIAERSFRSSSRIDTAIPSPYPHALWAPIACSPNAFKNCRAANPGVPLDERLCAPGSVGDPEFEVLVKIGLGLLSQTAPVQSVCRYDKMCGKPFELPWRRTLLLLDHLHMVIGIVIGGIRMFVDGGPTNCPW